METKPYGYAMMRDKRTRGRSRSGDVLRIRTCYNTKYKLNNGCSNNKAEQARAKAPEATEKTDIEESSPRTAAVMTDSKLPLGSKHKIQAK